MDGASPPTVAAADRAAAFHTEQPRAEPGLRSPSQLVPDTSSHALVGARRTFRDDEPGLDRECVAGLDKSLSATSFQPRSAPLLPTPQAGAVWVSS